MLNKKNEKEKEEREKLRTSRFAAAEIVRPQSAQSVHCAAQRLLMITARTAHNIIFDTIR